MKEMRNMVNVDCTEGRMLRMKDTQINIGLQEHKLPLHGAENPSTEKQGTSPGSFALKSKYRWANYISVHQIHPECQNPSTKTAWDFNPTSAKCNIQ